MVAGSDKDTAPLMWNSKMIREGLPIGEYMIGVWC